MTPPVTARAVVIACRAERSGDSLLPGPGGQEDVVVDARARRGTGTPAAACSPPAGGSRAGSGRRTSSRPCWPRTWPPRSAPGRPPRPPSAAAPAARPSTITRITGNSTSRSRAAASRASSASASAPPTRAPGSAGVDAERSARTWSNAGLGARLGVEHDRHRDDRPVALTGRDLLDARRRPRAAATTSSARSAAVTTRAGSPVPAGNALGQLLLADHGLRLDQELLVRRLAHPQADAAPTASTPSSEHRGHRGDHRAARDHGADPRPHAGAGRVVLARPAGRTARTAAARTAPSRPAARASA